MAEDFSNNPQLIRLAVDNEIFLEAQGIDVLAKDSDTKGMKGANGGSAWFFLAVVLFLSRCSGNEFADPALHFSSRLVREGHRKNL
jgi:hypothetical protein